MKTHQKYYKIKMKTKQKDHNCNMYLSDTPEIMMNCNIKLEFHGYTCTQIIFLSLSFGSRKCIYIYCTLYKNIAQPFMYHLIMLNNKVNFKKDKDIARVDLSSYEPQFQTNLQ